MLARIRHPDDLPRPRPRHLRDHLTEERRQREARLPALANQSSREQSGPMTRQRVPVSSRRVRSRGGLSQVESLQRNADQASRALTRLQGRLRSSSSSPSPEEPPMPPSLLTFEEQSAKLSPVPVDISLDAVTDVGSESVQLSEAFSDIPGKEDSLCWVRRVLCKKPPEDSLCETPAPLVYFPASPHSEPVWANIQSAAVTALQASSEFQLLPKSENQTTSTNSSHACDIHWLQDVLTVAYRTVSGNSSDLMHELTLTTKPFVGSRLLTRKSGLPMSDHQLWFRIANPKDLQTPSDSQSLTDLTPQGCGVDGETMLRPPGLLRPLLPHQARSLSWMARREEHGCGLFVCESRAHHAGIHPTIAQGVAIEWKMSKALEVHGGILCDPVGTGKTATCVALAMLDFFEAPVDTPQQRVSHESPSVGDEVNATLVLCPENVHAHWLEEAKLTVGSCVSLIPVHSVEELILPELLDRIARVPAPRAVIVPYSALSHSYYGQEESELLMKKRLRAHPAFIEWQMKDLREIKREVFTLEGISWRRLILDEVHELASSRHWLVGKQREAVRALQARFRWGLCGTPAELVASFETLQRCSTLFGADLDTVESARRFVDHFCRSATVQVDVEIKEEAIPIKLTSLERTIYEDAAHQVGSGLQEAILSGTRRLNAKALGDAAMLLKRCSHFEFHEGVDARNAVKRLKRDKAIATLAATEAMNDVGPCVEGLLMGLEDKPPWKAKVDVAKAFRANPSGFQYVVERWGLRQEDPDLFARLDANLRSNPRDCRGLLTKLHQAWRTAETSEAWFTSILDTTRHASAKRTCPVCLEDFDVILSGCALRCGHIFDHRCVKQLPYGPGRDAHRNCPVCRQEFGKRDVVMLRGLAAEQDPELTGRFAASGSKLRALGELLVKIQAVEPEAKVLIFCQWSDLETRIEKTLRSAFGFYVYPPPAEERNHLKRPTGILRLARAHDIFDRTDMITAFQNETGRNAPWAMLLSLENSASGTHLTAARHVVLVHPMVGASREAEAVMEQQAIGRVCRLGQQQAVVVWRLIACDTLEADIAARRM